MDPNSDAEPTIPRAEVDPVAEVRKASAQRALERQRTSPVWKWLMVLLAGSALTGFLGSEAKRSALISEKSELEGKLEIVEVERADFHDAWKEEETNGKSLAVQLDSVEKALSGAEQRTVTLMSEKVGLTGVIDDLKKSLATAIGDHQRTEASLSKVVSSLEAKNAELQASLNNEGEVVANLQSQLNDITQRLRIAEASSKSLQSDNDALQKRVATLSSALKAADAREADLRSRVTELVATNETLTKTLSDQKQRLSQAQKELSANKVELIGERLASQGLQFKLDLVSDAFASASAELEAVRLYREVPERKVADDVPVRVVAKKDEPIAEISVLGVDLGQVLDVLGQSEPPALNERETLSPR